MTGEVCISDRQGRLHEGGVGEGLRVIAQVSAGDGVHLLGVEAERAGPVNEVIEQFASVGGLPGPGRREPRCLQASTRSMSR